MSLFGPSTIEEAKAYRYGTWAGNPKGVKYREDRCMAEVSGTGWVYCQCSRKRGEDGFCFQHRPKKSK